jgi:hypothetical protein
VVPLNELRVVLPGTPRQMSTAFPLSPFARSYVLSQEQLRRCDWQRKLVLVLRLLLLLLLVPGMLAVASLPRLCSCLASGHTIAILELR